MLTRPAWVSFNERERRRLRYVWDDTRALLDFKGDASWVVGASMKMSLRARMALCMGLYEWVLWRFDGMISRPEPLQIAQAGWCATVDPRYLLFYELTRNEWQGPVDGPMWCATAWLQPAMSEAHRFPRHVYDAISFLTRLALHVVPDVVPFERWLALTLERLARDWPPAPDDPFSDLFSREPQARLGPLIGRSALDPALPPDRQRMQQFLADLLSGIRVSGNPFFATPDDLGELGFVGTPYVLPRI
ncbi:hypothetical protein CBA19CS22_34440 [Caballeronia novacaledonica]|uniref:Uncharacterized protein n=1 Tax=Caballeronia novacaledonica TaxID=1544861 RepID=A0ACB5R420_9BURK|nr:hypothetical protein CBA19CS22_34440 [Caballeronia novacaledonica]